MSEIEKIIEMLDRRITNDYKILEGDDDTLYIKSRETGKSYYIKVDECE